MADPRSVLERAMERVELRPFTLDGFHARMERKQRNQRIGAGVVGIAVFVAAVWIVTAGGAFDRSGTPATTGPTVGPEYPGQVGIVGLPPEDAIASSPSRGELVVGFLFGHTDGDQGRFVLNVYADGRLIWEQLGDVDRPYSTGLVEQRLTPEGVELIRSEVLSTGLFDRDRHLVGGYLPYYGQIEVRDGDRLVRISWGDTGPQPGTETVATPEQADALELLDARLEDLASWLPAAAWEDQELRAFVPSRYSVCYDAAQGIGLDRTLAALPRRAEDMLRPLERTHGEYMDGIRQTYDYWCSTVTTEQARAIAEVLDEAGFRSEADFFGLRYETRERDVDSISFEPLPPHLP